MLNRSSDKVANAQRYSIAVAHLVFGRQLIQRRIAVAPFNLKANLDAPDMHSPEWKTLPLIGWEGR
jgi:hypothetical protein